MNSFPIYNAVATQWEATPISGDVGFTSAGVSTVNSIQGVAISGTPAAGYTLVATSPTAAHWSQVQSSPLFGTIATSQTNIFNGGPFPTSGIRPVTFLACGGGGGGGGGQAGGVNGGGIGGGAGGGSLLQSITLNLDFSHQYNVVIGAGGAAGLAGSTPPTGAPGGNGGNGGTTYVLDATSNTVLASFAGAGFGGGGAALVSTGGYGGGNFPNASIQNNSVPANSAFPAAGGGGGAGGGSGGGVGSNGEAGTSNFSAVSFGPVGGNELFVPGAAGTGGAASQNGGGGGGGGAGAFGAGGAGGNGNGGTGTAGVSAAVNTGAGGGGGAGGAGSPISSGSAAGTGGSGVLIYSFQF